MAGQARILDKEQTVATRSIVRRFSKQIIYIRELSLDRVHRCPISQGLGRLLQFFELAMIEGYDRAASAAMCPASVVTNVFRLVSSESPQNSPVAEAERGDAKSAAAV